MGAAGVAPRLTGSPALHPPPHRGPARLHRVRHSCQDSLLPLSLPSPQQRSRGDMPPPQGDQVAVIPQRCGESCHYL
jgi:hypothetical protein